MFTGRSLQITCYSQGMCHLCHSTTEPNPTIKERANCLWYEDQYTLTINQTVSGLDYYQMVMYSWNFSLVVSTRLIHSKYMPKWELFCKSFITSGYACLTVSNSAASQNLQSSKFIKSLWRALYQLIKWTLYNIKHDLVYCKISTPIDKLPQTLQLLNNK